MTGSRLARLGVALAATATAFFLLGGPALAQDEKDCSDFATQEEAQKYFIDHGGPQSDPSMLDPDHDGQACEGLPSSSASPSATATPAATAAPRATATPSSNDLPNNGAFSGVMALSGMSFLELGAGLTLLASKLRKKEGRRALFGRTDGAAGDDVYLVRRADIDGRTRAVIAVRPGRPVDGIRARPREEDVVRARARITRDRQTVRRRKVASLVDTRDPEAWPFFTPPDE